MWQTRVLHFIICIKTDIQLFQIIGNKDAKNETITHEMQDIPPNAVATLPNDDADETIAHQMQYIKPQKGVATFRNDA